MPYIAPSDRDRLRPVLDEFSKALKERKMTAGELNYLVTAMCIHFMSSRGENYAVHNEVVGVLECARQEYCRRWVSPYEDAKLRENGDLP